MTTVSEDGYKLQVVPMADVRIRSATASYDSVIAMIPSAESGLALRVETPSSKRAQSLAICVYSGKRSSASKWSGIKCTLRGSIVFLWRE